MYVNNERNFPQAKFNSKIDACFLLNEHGDLYFYCTMLVYIFIDLFIYL